MLLAAVVGVDHLGLDLLDPARRPDGPALVAEVALDLAGDGRHRVGEEVAVLVDVELLGRADQGHAGDLLEVLHRDRPVAVAVRDRVSHSDVQDDDLVDDLVAPLALQVRGLERSRAVSSRRTARDGASSSAEIVMGGPYPGQESPETLKLLNPEMSPLGVEGPCRLVRATCTPCARSGGSGNRTGPGPSGPGARLDAGWVCGQPCFVSLKIRSISSILSSSCWATSASISPLVPLAPASLVASFTSVCSSGYFSKCGGLK